MYPSQGLPPLTIATNDYRRLMPLAKMLANEAHPLASPLLMALLRADLCEPNDLPYNVAAMDRFIGYRLPDEPMQYRALVLPERQIQPLTEVSILSPVGIALLGLRLGDRAALLGSDDGPAWVEVVGIGPRLASGKVPQGASARGARRRNRRSGDLPK